MGYNMTMIRINIADAKANLSRYLELVESGEVVVVCRRNVPIAELRAVPKRTRRPVRVGVGIELFGEWTVPDSFDDPLPDDILAVLLGEGP